eukprot:gene1507-32885_t
MSGRVHPPQGQSGAPLERQDSLGWPLVAEASFDNYGNLAPPLVKCLPEPSARTIQTHSELIVLLSIWDASWMGLTAANFTPSHSKEPSTSGGNAFAGSGPNASSNIRAISAPAHPPLAYPVISPSAMPLGYGSGVISRDPSTRGGNHPLYSVTTTVTTTTTTLVPGTKPPANTRDSRAQGTPTSSLSGAISIGGAATKALQRPSSDEADDNEIAFNMPMTPPLPHAALSLAKSRASTATQDPSAPNLTLPEAPPISTVANAAAHPVPNSKMQAAGNKGDEKLFKNVFFSPIPQSYLALSNSHDSLGPDSPRPQETAQESPQKVSKAGPVRPQGWMTTGSKAIAVGSPTLPSSIPQDFPFLPGHEREKDPSESTQHGGSPKLGRNGSTSLLQSTLSSRGSSASQSAASPVGSSALSALIRAREPGSLSSRSSDQYFDASAVSFTGATRTSTDRRSQGSSVSSLGSASTPAPSTNQAKGNAASKPASSSSMPKPIACAAPIPRAVGTDDGEDERGEMPQIPPTPPVPSGLMAQLSQAKADRQLGGGSAHLDLLNTSQVPSIAAAARSLKRERHPEWATLRLVASCAMIPHKDKVDKGGEDAYCICQNGLGSIGAADGVSGWAEEGIDPAEYSRTLMKLTAEKLESAGEEGIDSREVIRHAHMATYLPGSATICLAAMKPHGWLEVANVGDSGVRIVRDGKLMFASAAQQHMFNMPFQLSHPSIIDSPDDADSADVNMVEVQPGDVIILATDGLYDDVEVQPGDVIILATDGLYDKVEVQPGDVIILATDGLYDNVFDEEIVKLCHSASTKSLERIAEFRARNGPGAHHHFADYDEHMSHLQEEAQELADFLARQAHSYALTPLQKTPWSVSACEQGFAWSRYFAKGGGKMDDVTVVVAFVD